MILISLMSKEKSMPSIFELASKGFSIKYISHSVPIMYVVIFYSVTLIFLLPLAIVDSLIRIFYIIYILAGTIFIAIRFVNHKEDFVSEKVGLEYIKLSLGAKDTENITEGEVIEGTRPVFEENKPKQIKQSIIKTNGGHKKVKKILEGNKNDL
jgi:hypothetical protein